MPTILMPNQRVIRQSNFPTLCCGVTWTDDLQRIREGRDIKSVVTTVNMITDEKDQNTAALNSLNQCLLSSRPQTWVMGLLSRQRGEDVMLALMLRVPSDS